MNWTFYTEIIKGLEDLGLKPESYENLTIIAALSFMPAGPELISGLADLL